MGGSLSCGDCHYRNCLNAANLLSGPSSYRFAAEIFKLSKDRSEWIKVHPNVLSVTVSKRTDNPETIAELSAANLKNQNIFRLPIYKDSEIKKYSDRFVYWKSPDESVYALNVVSKTDIEQFCAVASGDVTSALISTHRFQCEMAPLMNARHGHVIEQENIKLSNCFVVFRPPDSIQFFDKDNNHLFSTSAFEIVLSVNEARRLVFLSFPSKAMALHFQQPDELRSFLQTVLNESSIALAGGIRSNDHVLSWLNKILDTVVALIRTPPVNPMTASTSSSSGVDLSGDPRLPGNAAAASKHYIETLYSLKYLLIFRIAVLKGVLPNPNFSEMIYPTELRARVASGHLANYVHLYCCLHAQFSIKKQLKDISESADFLKVLESNSRKTSEDPKELNFKQDPEGMKTKQPESRRIVDEKLLKSIVELVQTEETFVKDLEKLILQYIKPAELTILDCTEKLLKTHTVFLNSLQDAGGDLLNASSCEFLDYAQIKDSVMRISALFINKCNKFKIYSEYSAAYLKFQNLQKIDPELNEKLNFLNSSGQHKESVQSLLIKPIQRVLKYPLFLDQIKDFCSKNSMEQKQCIQALNRMQTLATYVNEMQRINEEYGSDLERLSKIPDLSQKGLWMDLRDLFMFSHLKLLQSGEKKYSNCVAFVFTSLILILGPESSKKKNFRPHKILPIYEIEINEDNNSIISENSTNQHFFSIIHLIPGTSETIYHISCCHIDIKTHFVKSVKKALKSYLKQKPRPVSGSSQSDWGYASAH